MGFPLRGLRPCVRRHLRQRGNVLGSFQCETVIAFGYTSTTGATDAGRDNADFDELNANGAVAPAEATVDAIVHTEGATGAGTEGFAGVLLDAPICCVGCDVFGDASVSTGCIGSEQLGTWAFGFGPMRFAAEGPSSPGLHQAREMVPSGVSELPRMSRYRPHAPWNTIRHCEKVSRPTSDEASAAW